MKKILIILGSTLIIALLFGTYMICNDIRIKKIDETKKKNYNEVIKVTEDTLLYKKNKEEYINIGKIKKDSILFLDKTNYNDNFFKLLDEEYYIEYKYIKPTKFESKIEYLPFNVSAITTDKFKINNIEINESSELNVYLKKENYFVKFNNQLLELDNKYLKETKEVNNGTYTDSISVLDLINYNEEELKLLNEYKTISLEQYKMWKNKEIELDINSILLISDKEDELFKKYNLIVNKSDLEFNKNDEVSTRDNLNCYKVDDITIETFKKMLNKEKIIKVVPIVVPTYNGPSVPVLNYHFFYDSNSEVCNETICLATSKFEEHLKYLKDNGFKTLTMKEFIAWYYGEIEIPEKSVLLTIDDGAMGTGLLNGNKLIPLLEKYDLHATLFLVTSWWDPKDYKSNNLDIESHSYDLHKVGSCGTQNIKCLSHEELYNDLKKSFDIVGSYDSFCFPFYVYTNDATQILSNLGIKVAFGGGNMNATRSSYKYYLPRYPIYSNITLDQFINMVN